MFLPKCYIEIYNPDTKTTVRFDYVNEIEVVTSTQNFTDTARVTVPRKVKFVGQSISNFIKRNNTISITTGYDGYTQRNIFKGYIKSVSTGTPIVIECENEAWKIKQIKLPAKHYPKLMLSAFIKEWMPNYVCNVPEVNFGEVRIALDTPLSKIFDYFMSNYPIKFYFRGDEFFGTLPGTMAFRKEDVKTVKFDIGWNTTQENLTYTLADDVKLQVVAKAITKGNTKIEYKWPADNADCEVRTFLVPSAQTVGELEIYAKDMAKKFKIDKMEGSFVWLGEPFVRKADLGKLYDENNKDQDNKLFIVDGVTYSFGQSGYKQTITLGAQIHE